ncbi:pre-mRNA-splicing factor Cwc15p [[Candida] anglica]|uniref:Pre-mRNA-splicing factor CWC15 n=1 Tax=[Candida] anglica TaxID=148631 RepID=A0ABP0EII1_9ASCO
MTTNHRPTLEAKRGKSQGIRDSIAHSRALPQQTKLKYRSDIDPDVAKRAVEELKEDLIRNNKRSIDVDGNSSKRRKDLEGSESAGDENSKINVEDLNIAKKESEDGNESQDEEDVSQSEDESEYSSDESDDETEQLLQELNKIKEEREAAKKLKESQERTSRAINSNPLLKVGNEPKAEVNIKKGWRNATAFRNQQPSSEQSKEESYTSSTLKSDTHKKFLSKYIR